MVKYLFVGVDPGTTCAVAAVDFKGRVAGLVSAKEMGLASVVKYILSFGQPSVVACDVYPAPDFVSKVASKFGVYLFVPRESLSVSEKIDLTRGSDCRDAHQRDALASALYAYSRCRGKLDKIESLGLGSKVKHFVLQGNSISRAKSQVKTKQKKKQEPKPKPAPEKVSVEQRRIRLLEKRVKVLSGELAERDIKIRQLKKDFKKAERRASSPNKPAADDELRIGNLKSQIHDLKDVEELLRDVAAGRTQLVGIYPNVYEGLTLSEDRPENLKGVKVAFTSKRKVKEHLKNQGIQVYDSSELSDTRGFKHIKREKLKKLRDESVDIEKLITDYRKKRS